MPKPQGRKGRAHMREPKEYEEEVIQIDRVTRVVKGGRRLRFRATVVIGNKKGKVGVGIGKSTEVTGAIQKAISKAKKTLITVPMVGQTIPHKVKLKYKSAHLLLMPACPGTGIIAGGPLRKIIELSGIEDILSKSLGNNNKLTNSQAAIMALQKLQEMPWITKKQEAAKKEQEAKAQKTKEKAGKPQAKKAVKEPTKADPQAKKSEKKAEPKTPKKGPASAKQEKTEKKETSK